MQCSKHSVWAQEVPSKHLHMRRAYRLCSRMCIHVACKKHDLYTHPTAFNTIQHSITHHASTRLASLHTSHCQMPALHSNQLSNYMFSVYCPVSVPSKHVNYVSEAAWVCDAGTPKPTRQPKPTKTPGPKPTWTPSPTETGECWAHLMWSLFTHVIASCSDLESEHIVVLTAAKTWAYGTSYCCKDSYIQRKTKQQHQILQLQMNSSGPTCPVTLHWRWHCSSWFLLLDHVMPRQNITCI